MKVLKELLIIIFIKDNPLKVSVQYPVNIVNDVVLAILWGNDLYYKIIYLEKNIVIQVDEIK